MAATIAAALLVYGCGIKWQGPGAQLPAPVPTPAPHLPICDPAIGLVTACWHQPPGSDWLFIPATAPTVDDPLDCDGPVGQQLGVEASLGKDVNAAILRAYGCDGGRCLVNESRFAIQRRIVNELRAAGLCAGQHEPGTSADNPGSDEIAVATSKTSTRESYHVAAGDKLGPLTLTLSPQSNREAYLPACPIPPCGVPGPVTTPRPTPKPQVDPTPTPGAACPFAPCPLREWTREALPDGWDSNLIGKPANHFNSAPWGNGSVRDFTVIVERQPDYCAHWWTGRADCAVRIDGHLERKPVEDWLTYGGLVREGRNGQQCEPEARFNLGPSFLVNGSGNCRMCNAKPAGDPLRVCSEWF
jgi:hypothetical protein